MAAVAPGLADIDVAIDTKFALSVAPIDPIDKNNLMTLIKNGLYYQQVGNNISALVSFSSAASYLYAKDPSNRLYRHAMMVLLGYVEGLQEKTQHLQSGTPKDKKEEEAIECVNMCEMESTALCLTFADVVGMQKEKNLMVTAIVKPLVYPNLYTKSAKGVLLFGPPGTGKTFLVKALIRQLQIEYKDSAQVLFFNLTGADLKGKYVGETEKKIVRAYTCAARRACQATDPYSEPTCTTTEEGRAELKALATNSKNVIKQSPQYVSVIFIDEFDSVGGDRNKDETGLVANSVNTLLQMMDGVQSFKNVITIAATNYPWSLDAALLRRFNEHIYCKVPEVEDVKKLITQEMKNRFTIVKKNQRDFCGKDISDINKQIFKPSDQLLEYLGIKRGADKKKTGCPPTFTDQIDKGFEWPLSVISRDYMKMDSPEDAAVAVRMDAQNYSNSDISSVVQKAFNKLAETCISDGVWYQIRENSKSKLTEAMNALATASAEDQSYAQATVDLEDAKETLELKQTLFDNAINAIILAASTAKLVIKTGGEELIDLAKGLLLSAGELPDPTGPALPRPPQEVGQAVAAIDEDKIAAKTHEIKTHLDSIRNAIAAEDAKASAAGATADVIAEAAAAKAKLINDYNSVLGVEQTPDVSLAGMYITQNERNLVSILRAVAEEAETVKARAGGERVANPFNEAKIKTEIAKYNLNKKYIDPLAKELAAAVEAARDLLRQQHVVKEKYVQQCINKKPGPGTKRELVTAATLIEWVNTTGMNDALGDARLAANALNPGRVFPKDKFTDMSYENMYMAFVEFQKTPTGGDRPEGIPTIAAVLDILKKKYKSVGSMFRGVVDNLLGSLHNYKALYKFRARLELFKIIVSLPQPTPTAHLPISDIYTAIEKTLGFIAVLESIFSLMPLEPLVKKPEEQYYWISKLTKLNKSDPVSSKNITEMSKYIQAQAMANVAYGPGAAAEKIIVPAGMYIDMSGNSAKNIFGTSYPVKMLTSINFYDRMFLNERLIADLPTELKFKDDSIADVFYNLREIEQLRSKINLKVPDRKNFEMSVIFTRVMTISNNASLVSTLNGLEGWVATVKDTFEEYIIAPTEDKLSLIGETLTALARFDPIYERPMTEFLTIKGQKDAGGGWWGAVSSATTGQSKLDTFNEQLRVICGDLYVLSPKQIESKRRNFSKGTPALLNWSLDGADNISVGNDIVKNEQMVTQAAYIKHIIDALGMNFNTTEKALIDEVIAWYTPQTISGSSALAGLGSGSAGMPTMQQNPMDRAKLDAYKVVLAKFKREPPPPTAAPPVTLPKDDIANIGVKKVFYFVSKIRPFNASWMLFKSGGSIFLRDRAAELSSMWQTLYMAAAGSWYGGDKKLLEQLSIANEVGLKAVISGSKRSALEYLLKRVAYIGICNGKTDYETFKITETKHEFLYYDEDSVGAGMPHVAAAVTAAAAAPRAAAPPPPPPPSATGLLAPGGSVPPPVVAPDKGTGNSFDKYGKDTYDEFIAKYNAFARLIQILPDLGAEYRREQPDQHFTGLVDENPTDEARWKTDERRDVKEKLIKSIKKLLNIKRSSGLWPTFGQHMINAAPYLSVGGPVPDGAEALIRSMLGQQISTPSAPPAPAAGRVGGGTRKNSRKTLNKTRRAQLVQSGGAIDENSNHNVYWFALSSNERNYGMIRALQYCIPGAAQRILRAVYEPRNGEQACHFPNIVIADIFSSEIFYIQKGDKSNEDYPTKYSDIMPTIFIQNYRTKLRGRKEIWDTFSNPVVSLYRYNPAHKPEYWGPFIQSCTGLYYANSISPVVKFADITATANYITAFKDKPIELCTNILTGSWRFVKDHPLISGIAATAVVYQYRNELVSAAQKGSTYVYSAVTPGRVLAGVGLVGSALVVWKYGSTISTFITSSPVKYVGAGVLVVGAGAAIVYNREQILAAFALAVETGLTGISAEAGVIARNPITTVVTLATLGSVWYGYHLRSTAFIESVFSPLITDLSTHLNNTTAKEYVYFLFIATAWARPQLYTSDVLFSIPKNISDAWIYIDNELFHSAGYTDAPVGSHPDDHKHQGPLRVAPFIKGRLFYRAIGLEGLWNRAQTIESTADNTEKERLLGEYIGILAKFSRILGEKFWPERLAGMRGGARATGDYSVSESEDEDNDELEEYEDNDELEEYEETEEDYDQDGGSSTPGAGGTGLRFRGSAASPGSGSGSGSASSSGSAPAAAAATPPLCAPKDVLTTDPVSIAEAQEQIDCILEHVYKDKWTVEHKWLIYATINMKFIGEEYRRDLDTGRNELAPAALKFVEYHSKFMCIILSAMYVDSRGDQTFDESPFCRLLSTAAGTILGGVSVQAATAAATAAVGAGPAAVGYAMFSLYLSGGLQASERAEMEREIKAYLASDATLSTVVQINLKEPVQGPPIDKTKCLNYYMDAGYLMAAVDSYPPTWNPDTGKKLDDYDADRGAFLEKLAKESKKA